MPKPGFSSVTIEDDTGKAIKKILKGPHGYQSKAEVVRDAVRRLRTQLAKGSRKRKEATA